MSKKSKRPAQLSFDFDAIDIDELAGRFTAVIADCEHAVACYRASLENIAGCSLDDWPLESLLAYGDLALDFGKRAGYFP